MRQREVPGGCACKGCTKPAIISLKLRYLNLTGHFCSICADSLINDGLAVEEFSDLKEKAALSATVSSHIQTANPTRESGGQW